MAGRRGARSGRGWDAAPPRTGGRRSRRGPATAPDGPSGWPAEEQGWPTDAAAQPRSGRLDGGGGGRPGRRRAAAGSDAAEPQPPRDEAEIAREICLRQLAVRPRTRAELAAALARRGISAETAAQVLDRYDEVGMIDDAAFARAWVASRHHGRGLARRALATELRQRGVDSDTAGAALGALDEATEAATARALVDRKLRTTTGAPEAVFRRLVGMLARKGYPPGVAIRAVKDGMAAQSAEAAEFAEHVDADALADAEAELDRDDRPVE